MRCSIIAATSQNGIIGINNKLPFDYKSDLKHFRKMTTSHTNSIVVMGRKTFEGIGKPLPNRTNIIISNTLNIKDTNIIVHKSMADVFKYYNDIDCHIWLIGGSSIYEEGLKYADDIYLTLTPDIIDVSNVDEYARFPWINPSKFNLNYVDELDQNYGLQLAHYVRI